MNKFRNSHWSLYICYHLLSLNTVPLVIQHFSAGVVPSSSIYNLQHSGPVPYTSWASVSHGARTVTNLTNSNKQGTSLPWGLNKGMTNFLLGFASPLCLLSFIQQMLQSTCHVPALGEALSRHHWSKQDSCLVKLHSSTCYIIPHSSVFAILHQACKMLGCMSIVPCAMPSAYYVLNKYLGNACENAP